MKGITENEQNIRTAADLVDFAKFLANEVDNDPEFREKFLSDGFLGLAAWMEESPDKVPEHPDWRFVGKLLSVAVFFD